MAENETVPIAETEDDFSPGASSDPGLSHPRSLGDEGSRGLAVETEEWLSARDLTPEQRPLGWLLQSLADSMEEKPTAAAAEQYRRTVLAITGTGPSDDQVQSLTDAILNPERS